MTTTERTAVKIETDLTDLGINFDRDGDAAYNCTLENGFDHRPPAVLVPADADELLPPF